MTNKEMNDAAAKAEVLIESLQWLKKFQGAVVVIKFGGNAMVSPELMRSFAEDIVYLKFSGLKPVVVHGGGPQINEMLEKLGIKSEFKAGLRVTTPETMDVVRMVLTGQVNPKIVDMINTHGPFAAGIAGEDAGLLRATRRANVFVEGEEIDLGLVGDVTDVRPDSVLALLDRGIIPVISSIAPEKGNSERSLNVNADSAAASLAVALKAEKLVILTDVAGLYENWPDETSLMTSITVNKLSELMPSLESGMIPKMQACLDAVEAGVPKAAIIDGRVPHSLLLEIFTEAGIGTEIVPAE